MTKIIIREYMTSDAKNLAEIYYYTIHNINSRDYTEEQINAWAPITSLELTGWKTKWEKTPPIVAVSDNVILGFAEFEASGHIDCFYVHHLYQANGVGAALMAAIDVLANQYGCKRIYAEVSITAKSFFERKGFKVIREQMVTFRDVQFKNYVMEKLCYYK
jgi:putative acetyltransferase